MIRAFLVCLLWLIASPAVAFDPCDEADKAGYTPITERYQIGLLFTIRKCGVGDSYAFGTYHSDSARVWNNASPAISAMKTTQTAVFEVESPLDHAYVREAMYFPEGATENLRTLIGESDFNTLWNAMNATQPISPENLATMRPWAAAISLQMPTRQGDGMILDDKMQQAARLSNIQIAALETTREQFDVFTQLSEAQQVALLKDAIRFIPQNRVVSDKLELAYLEGRLKDMQALSLYAFNLTTDMALSQLLVERLVTSRNQTMANRAIPYLDQGSTFIAVGALHLMGDQGLLPLLEQQGFYIFPVN